MRNAKLWLVVAFVVAALSVSAVLVDTAVSQAAPQPVLVKDHWRHHDGHWSYWHEGDKRWYYTDGMNWYYNTGEEWKLYPFDKQFGRQGFERGEYRVPGPDVKVIVPGHRIFRP